MQPDPERRRKLMFLDQLAMVEIFSPEVNKYGLSYAILGEAWNFRGEPGKRRLFGGPMIDHQPGLRVRLWFDMLLVAFGFWKRGNKPAAFGVYRHVMRRRVSELEGFQRPVLLAELRKFLATPEASGGSAAFDQLAELESAPPDFDEHLRAAVMHAKIGQRDHALAICRSLTGAGVD